eukprot:7385543-Prymnesium_polylepis.1
MPSTSSRRKVLPAPTNEELELAKARCFGFDAGVGATALWIANARAARGLDPFAEQFAGVVGAQVEEALGRAAGFWFFTDASGKKVSNKIIPYIMFPWLGDHREWRLAKREPPEKLVASSVEQFRNGIELRTRFFDSKMGAAIDRGLTQIVTLASGCDTRCVRLEAARKPGVRHWLIDQPSVIERYESVLRDQITERSDSVNLIPVKFGVDSWVDKLGKAGFDSTVPTLFMVEGLTMYLEQREVEELFFLIGSIAAPGSEILGDYISGGMLRSPALRRLHAQLTELKCPWTWSAANSRGFRLMMRTCGVDVVRQEIAAKYANEPLTHGYGLCPFPSQGELTSRVLCLDLACRGPETLQHFADRYMPWVPAYWVYQAMVTEQSRAETAQLSTAHSRRACFDKHSVNKASASASESQ